MSALSSSSDGEEGESGVVVDIGATLTDSDCGVGFGAA